MSFHLFLSCPALFTLPYVPKSDQSHISFIHIHIGQPTFFFPFNLPSSICRCDKPLEPLSTCPAYSNFLFIISFVKCKTCAEGFKWFVTSTDTGGQVEGKKESGL